MFLFFRAGDHPTSQLQLTVSNTSVLSRLSSAAYRLVQTAFLYSLGTDPIENGTSLLFMGCYAYEHQEQESGQSAQALNVNSALLNNMFRIITAVQQIMTELNEAMSEEDKIVAITRIVINLMKQDGC
jgi:hypothetical protein